MSNPWTLAHAIEIAITADSARVHASGGSLWFGGNQGIADATFQDWGSARATAVILNAVKDGKLVLATPVTEAAPDLLAALKDTLNMLRAAHMQCGIRHDGNKRVIAARAVVVKATGAA